VRTYPEIMVRSVVAPGSEKVLEDMFNYEHDHPHRYDLKLDDLNWADIVSALIRHGIGTALAYIDNDDQVVCHPPTNEEIKGKGLIVLVRSADTPGVEVVQEALDRYRAFLASWHDKVKPAGDTGDGKTKKSLRRIQEKKRPPRAFQAAARAS